MLALHHPARTMCMNKKTSLICSMRGAGSQVMFASGAALVQTFSQLYSRAMINCWRALLIKVLIFIWCRRCIFVLLVLSQPNTADSFTSSFSSREIHDHLELYYIILKTRYSSLNRKKVWHSSSSSTWTNESQTLYFDLTVSFLIQVVCLRAKTIKTICM